MKVRFAPEALARIREERAWWEEHRDKAPWLFRDELRDAVGKIRRGTDQARRSRTFRGEAVWVLALKKTRHWTFYRISRGEAEVITVWNAQAGGDPRL